MSEAEVFESMAAALARTLKARMNPQPGRSVHGGCINSSYRWESERGPFFVKVAPRQMLGMFEAEAAGLHELRRVSAVRVPQALAVGAVEERAYLALEWIDLRVPSSAAHGKLGEQLAHQHRVGAAAFGWDRGNTIGSTSQPNPWTNDWIAFFRDQRLGHQLDLAQSNGYGGRLQERCIELLDRMPALFASYQPEPALLHGDLWGGNWAMDAQGRPVIFDPAVYYGDREADLAMTRLFGGFGAGFYAAYEAAWPLAAGARGRIELYNLYHVLNHLNLFGAGYLRQAESMIDRLLARC